MATPSTPSFLKPTEANVSSAPFFVAPSAAPVSKEKHKKASRGILLGVFGVLLIAGAAFYFLFPRYRTTARHHENASSLKASARETSTTTVALPLDPFVVNLADSGGHSYARIGLTLQLIASPDASAKDGNKGATATGPTGSRDLVRDTIITVLNQEQSADLLALDGKERLKQAIRAAIAARDPQLKIADIYFTEFLIQP